MTSTSNPGRFGTFARRGLLVGAALVALSIAGGSFYTIDQGERGIILRNGAFVGVAQPGLGFKLPWIDSVERVSIQSHVARDEFQEMHTYSQDQQPAVLRLSVNYRVPEGRVAEVYSSYGSLDGLVQRIVYPHVYQEAKVVFGKFNAVAAIQQRERLNAEIAGAIQEAVKGPVLIESVQVENIDFSKAYEASIEQRMLAEVEVQRIRQNADREKVQAQITVTQAQAKADAVRAAAQAEADAIRLRGEAEAGAIKARAAALAENQNLVALTQAERWDGKLPTTMVPGSAVPMLSLNR